MIAQDVPADAPKIEFVASVLASSRWVATEAPRGGRYARRQLAESTVPARLERAA